MYIITIKKCGKKLYVQKWRGKENYQIKGNRIMGDFSRFQLFHESCYYFKSQFIYSHSHWFTKKQGSSVKRTVQVQWDSSANQRGTWKGRLYVRTANVDGSRAMKVVCHVPACFLPSNLLPWKPASQSHASRPWLFRPYVHRSQEYFHIGTSNSPNAHSVT